MGVTGRAETQRTVRECANRGERRHGGLVSEGERAYESRRVKGRVGERVCERERVVERVGRLLLCEEVWWRRGRDRSDGRSMSLELI